MDRVSEALATLMLDRPEACVTGVRPPQAPAA